METIFFPLIAFTLKLFTAVTAYVCMRLVLRQLDKSIEFNFKEWFKNAHSKDKALYLSSRYFATALFFALLLS